MSEFDLNACSKVTVYAGEEAVRKQKQIFEKLGKALIISGKTGADKCGAFGDVSSVLKENSIGYIRYNNIAENPRIENCYEAGTICREEGCSCIIAIGGGSVIDAAKAASFYASHTVGDIYDIFDSLQYTGKNTPIIAIPTTAGTGSEVNRYSVLTVEGGKRKRTYKTDFSYPDYAIVDYRYTLSLNGRYRISTALDAFAHSLESYVSPKSTDVSRNCALYSANKIWNVISRHDFNTINDIKEIDSEDLSLAATAAGIAIDITGTGFPHPMGYGLTLDFGIPHGLACSVFESDFIEYNSKTENGKELIDRFARYLDSNPEEISNRLSSFYESSFRLNSDSIDDMITRIENAGNFKNSPYILNRNEMFDIYKKHFI